MKKALKWVGIVVGGLVVVLITLVGILTVVGSNKLNQSYEITPLTVSVPTDAATVAQGEHLVRAVGACIGCHGVDLSGAVFEDDPAFGKIIAPNLTSGKGGVGATNSDNDWVLAIRHGVGHDGRGLLFMPSASYNNFSDEDLGAIIAYLKSLPAVDNELGKREPGPMLQVLFAVGAFTSMADNIDHDTRPATPAAGSSASYGEYLTSVGACQDCHGEGLAGQTDPNAPQGPNLTPAGEIGGWSESDFISLMRTGVEPNGGTISEEMPWIEYKDQTDDELKAIWAYLNSMDPVTTAGK